MLRRGFNKLIQGFQAQNIFQNSSRTLGNRTFSTNPEADLIDITVDGRELRVPRTTRVMDAVSMAGGQVPHMCYHPDMPQSGGVCRICVVEDSRYPGNSVISCKARVDDVRNIVTNSENCHIWRKANAALMLGSHPSTCLTCVNNNHCRTKTLASDLGLCISTRAKTLMYTGEPWDMVDKSSVIRRDNKLCIGCDRCVEICKEQGIGALRFYTHHTNVKRHTTESFGPLDTTNCVQCGQCINRCPTGALSEQSELDNVWRDIWDPDKKVVFQIAPAIRVALAEEFGSQAGEMVVKGGMVTALKRLGNDITVFDTDFTADLTIIEEGYELIERLNRILGGERTYGKDIHMPSTLPMMTSCCPGWVNFVEKTYPEMLHHLSSTKSPHQMLGALAKHYWSGKVNVDPSKISVVSVMPCTAKKVEKTQHQTFGLYDVDHVLTTRELGQMLRQLNLDPRHLPDTPFDSVMGESSGAGVIFGATGGVMEAALRTAYEVITGREVPFKNLDISPCRGMAGVKEATIKFEKVKPEFSRFEGVEMKIAIANDLQNTRNLVEKIKEADEKGLPPPWHFVEIMACPSGCIGGGGQPKPTNLKIRQARADLTYMEDKDLPWRKSHEVPEIKTLYEEYLKAPLGHHSHHLLHRNYQPRPLMTTQWIQSDESRGIENVLMKFPKNKKDLLIEMLIAESDRTGYVSDASIIKLAEHTGLPPVEVDAISSSYTYFNRKPVGDMTVYFCQCINCRLKGMQQIERISQAILGTRMGQTTRDDKITLKQANWHGWCVNDAPAVMIKKRGTDVIYPMMGLTMDNIENNLFEMESHNMTTPPNNIIYSSLKRYGRDMPSLMARVRINEDDKQYLNPIGRKAAEMGAERILEEIKLSGLTGRGGAGFSTATKWEYARKMEADEKYVVCNADEGLPSCFKDWTLLIDPQSRMNLIVGMGICARTIGSKKAFIYLRYEYRNLKKDLEETIRIWHRKNPEQTSLDFEIRLGVGPYVAGEESAQFESIEGRGPRPRRYKDEFRFPTAWGLFDKPTVINNVETFSCIPYIIYEGGKKWGSVGEAGQRGPKLFGITGDVDQPRLMEFPLGTSLHQIISECELPDIMCAEVGGSTEKLIFPKDYKMTTGFGPTAELNGVGSVVLFNSMRNVMDIYEQKMEFMAEESCKQCVPCRDGGRIFMEAFDLMKSGKPLPNERALQAVCNACGQTSICAHGKASGTLFKDILAYQKLKSASGRIF